MLHEVLRELSTICTAFTVLRLSQSDVTVNLTSVLLIWQSDSGAPVCARVSRRKADTLNTNLASSLRPLLVDTAICFSEWLWCLPALVVDFRCCLCDRVDFCPAVFYTVSAASQLKGVVINLASPDVS